MKKILLISSNPAKKNGLADGIIIDSAEKVGADLATINLYERNLPLFKGENVLCKEARDLFGELDKHDRYVFVFPVWWSNMPAILKNLFDWSVLWGIKWNRRSVCTPALKNKKALVVCSAGDKYPKDTQKKVLSLVSSNILKLWGVRTTGEIFINGSYEFSEKPYRTYVDRTANLLRKL